jgi:hypothetical protein
MSAAPGSGCCASNTADVVELSPATEDFTATVNYGLPAHGDWQVIVSSGDNYFVQIQLGSGSAATLPELAGFDNFTPLAATADPILPILGPALNPTVDGQDLFTPQVVATLSPTFAWQAPTLGTPDVYDLRIFQISVSAGITVATAVIAADTSDTQFTFPADTFTPGASYVLTIRTRTATAQTRLASAMFQISNSATGAPGRRAVQLGQ